MNQIVRDTDLSSGAPWTGSIEVVSRSELVRHPRWARAFAGARKDSRYYEIVEDTIGPELDYRYFVIKDESGAVRAVAPFFLLDQDLVAGAGHTVRGVAARIRRVWRRFLFMRTLMVGCAAGEGHLDDGDEIQQGRQAELLAPALRKHAAVLGARLIVLKEFPARYRAPMEWFRRHGYARIPSMPMTRLNIGYASFEELMQKSLSAKTRKDLRVKFRAAAKASPIELRVTGDITPVVDEVHALYLQVHSRSKLQFEKLTKDYLCQIGQRMPDRVRFFVWRQDGRIVAFSLCMIHEDSIYAEYLGMDYEVALDLHLYHYALRDVTAWGMARGLKWFRSTGLNYDPKLHLRCQLDPLDLYVTHTSRVANAILHRVLPWLEPTRSDQVLRRFPDYPELWGPAVAAGPVASPGPNG